MKKNVRDREPFLLIETGTREDSLGRVVSEDAFRSVRGARDRLAELREEWQRQGWTPEFGGSAVWWRGDEWIQGLVVDERGEIV